MDNDLIRRSALKQDLLARGFWPAIVKYAVESAPAVDAVEVVRCKDCIHYEKTMLYSECWHALGMINVYDDCYCSRGKRRDDAETEE